MSRRSSSDSVTSKATSTVKKPYDPTHSSYKSSGSSYPTSYPTGANKRPEHNKKPADGKVRISPESRPGRAQTATRAPLTASNLKTVPVSSTAGLTVPSVAGTSARSTVASKVPGQYSRGKVKISAESRPKPAEGAKKY